MIDYTLPLDQLPDPLPIEPLTKPFDVTITPPGSKSITCRAYVLAALAEGESKIIRPLRADDTDHLLNALCTLGAEARWVPGEGHDGEDVLIKGVAGRFPRGGNLYMGDGGTPTRFMIACACLAKEPVVIDASPRMRERPIAEGVDMLRQLGAKIEYVEEEGRLPVRVAPTDIKGGNVRIGKTISSQFISGLLLIAGVLERGVKIEFSDAPASETYVVLTLQIIDDWGPRYEAKIDNNVGFCRVFPERIITRDYRVEPDASSAVYWVEAAAVVPQSQMIIRGILGHSSQPDLGIVVYLECAGIYYDSREENVLVVRGPKQFNGMKENASHSPDAAVALGVIAARAASRSRFHGLRTLRVKETDRIAALANELRKVGCTVETGEDWISITPPAKFSRAKEAASDDQREEDGGGNRDAMRAQSPSSSPSTPVSKPITQGGSSDAASTSNSMRDPIIIETYNDHRMAMAFAVLGLNAPNGLRLAIRNPKCVAKSYPGFWKDFAKLYG